MPEIPDTFWGWKVDAGPEPTYEEKMRVPALGWNPSKNTNPNPTGGFRSLELGVMWKWTRKLRQILLVRPSSIF